MLDVDDDTAVRLGQYTAQDTESGGIERIDPKRALAQMGNRLPSGGEQSQTGERTANNTAGTQELADGQQRGAGQRDLGNSNKNVWSASSVQNINPAVNSGGLRTDGEAGSSSVPKGTPPEHSSEDKDSEKAGTIQTPHERLQEDYLAEEKKTAEDNRQLSGDFDPTADNPERQASEPEAPQGQPEQGEEQEATPRDGFAGMGEIDVINQIAEEASKKQDGQGNPLNADGSLKVEAISSIDELTDEDITNPTRNVQLPELPENVATAIGTDGKPVVIKKNIFEKNSKSHKDLTPAQSREILQAALYNADLYGQNKKTSRPYNWILIHLSDDRNSAVLIEVANEKDRAEIVNWHYLRADSLRQKERQAVKEGGLILALPDKQGNAAGDASDNLPSVDKGSKKNSTAQEKQYAESENAPKQLTTPNADTATTAGKKATSKAKQEQQTSPYVPKKGSPARQFLDAYEHLEEAKRKYSEIKERMAEIKGLTLLPTRRDDDNDRASTKGRYNGYAYALTKLARALKYTKPEISARIETELAKHKKDKDLSGVITWINDLKRTSETVRDTIGTLEEEFEKEFKKEYDKLSGELRSASAEESNAMAALYATMDQIRTDCEEGRASFGELLQFIQVSATGLDLYIGEGLKDYYEAAPEPFVQGNGKHKFDIHSFCAGKEAKSPALMGVHYSNGTVTASDGQMLVQKKKDYSAEKEGKTIGKDGSAIESEFPDVESVPPKDVSGLPSVDFDATDLERWCSAAVEQAKQARRRAQTKIPAKYDGSTTVIKVSDQYAWYDTERLYQFAQAAVEIGATKLYLYRRNGFDTLYTESDMGRVMLMPIWGNADFGALGVYSYKRAGETTRSGIGHQVKREPINTAGKGVIDVVNQIAQKENEKQDSQGNPLNADGNLKVETISAINELTDEDFTNPTRNVQLPELPENVAAAIGTDGKPVVIKKNILKRNTEHHPDVSPSQSREILKAALYTPDLYGQNQRASRPYNWVLISVKGEDGRNKLVLLEVNHNKDFAEIVHWHFVEDKAIEKIKKQAEREGGQLLILPSVDTEEAGALSGRPSGSASEDKGSKKDSATQRKQPTTAEKIEDYGEEIAGARKNMLLDLARELGLATVARFIELPLSKALKKINFTKAVEAGALRASDVPVVFAMYKVIENGGKPRINTSYPTISKGKIIAWAKNAAGIAALMKEFIEADGERRDVMIAEIKAMRPTYVGFSDSKEEGNFNALPILIAAMGDFGVDEVEQINHVPTGSISMTEDGRIRFAGIIAKDIEDLAAEVRSMIEIGNGLEHDFTADELSIQKRPELMKDKFEGGVVYLDKGETKREGKVFDSLEEARAYSEKLYKEKTTQQDAARKGYVPYARQARKSYFVVLFNDDINRTWHRISQYSTREEALAAIDTDLPSLSEKANEVNKTRFVTGRGKKGNSSGPKAMKILVYFDSRTKTYFVAPALPSNMREIFKDLGADRFSPIFKTPKEAFAFRDTHMQEIQKLVSEIMDAVKKAKKESGSSLKEGANNPRKGKDWRNGKDITAEDFAVAFGFRGVQFGNWTDQKDRQGALNQAYDAFMDMAEIIGLSPRALSLNGELGIAFGSRGTGKASAHYEADEVVINITKTRGAGSLAHEWWHALDNYLSRSVGADYGYATDLLDRNANLRAEVANAIRDLMNAVRRSAYYKRSDARGAYWRNNTELGARLFSSWVERKLEEKGNCSPFLADHKEEERAEACRRAAYTLYGKLQKSRGEEVLPYEKWKPDNQQAVLDLPYAVGDELVKLGERMQALFDVLQDHADEQTGKTVLFNIGRKKGAAQNRTAHSEKAIHVSGVSGDALAKVRENLETLALVYEKRGDSAKGLISDLSKALHLEQHGASNYGSFVLPGGRVVTLRISNHNANVEHFDANGETEEISIVVTNRKDRGLQGDGVAHVVEFFYGKRALERAGSQSMANIIRSLEGALETGIYIDATGIAHVDEANAPDVDVEFDGETGSADSLSQPHPVEDIRAVTADMQGKFDVEAEVIESLDDVQDAEARKRIAAGDVVKGWYDPKMGKVFLYAPNIESEQDAMATYAHEVIAHKGMEGLLGEERYKELCERLDKVLTPEQRKNVEAYEGSDNRTLGDEYIARIAETLIDENGNIKEPTTWEKVKAAVRDFFRDVFEFELTDADIRYMLWRSADRLRREKASPRQQARDVETAREMNGNAVRMRRESSPAQDEHMRQYLSRVSLSAATAITLLEQAGIPVEIVSGEELGHVHHSDNDNGHRRLLLANELLRYGLEGIADYVESQTKKDDPGSVRITTGKRRH